MHYKTPKQTLYVSLTCKLELRDILSLAFKHCIYFTTMYITFIFIYKYLQLAFINTNFSNEKSDNDCRLGLLTIPAKENSRSTGAEDVKGVFKKIYASLRK